MDARLYNWTSKSPSAKGQKGPAGVREAQHEAAQAITEIREAAEHIRAAGATLDEARAAAARVIELCNHLEQFPIAAARAVRAAMDRRQGERRADAGQNTGEDGAAQPPGGVSLASPDPLTDPRLRALSKRELQVFKLLAEGQSAAEIAARLSRSSKTIHNHRTRILQKLGLKNATELVRLAMRCGLVSI